MARPVWQEDDWDGPEPWALEVVPLLGGHEFAWQAMVLKDDELIGERRHVRSGVAGSIEDAKRAARQGLAELRDDGQLSLTG